MEPAAVNIPAAVPAAASAPLLDSSGPPPLSFAATLGGGGAEPDPSAAGSLAGPLIQDLANGVGAMGLGPNSTSGKTDKSRDGGDSGGSSGVKPSSINNKDDNKGKLFVGGLNWETSKERLVEYFAKFGEVQDCVIMADPQTQRSRGFGFITFTDPKSCDVVMAAVPHTLDDRQIDPKPAVPRGTRARTAPKATKQHYKTNKIFVGGLAADTSQEMLTVFFSEYGKVENVILMFDRETKRPRGFGFVTFSATEPVANLCKLRFVELNGKMVEMKMAQPKASIDGRRSNRSSFGSGQGAAAMGNPYTGYAGSQAGGYGGYNAQQYAQAYGAQAYQYQGAFNPQAYAAAQQQGRGGMSQGYVPGYPGPGSGQYMPGMYYAPQGGAQHGGVPTSGADAAAGGKSQQGGQPGQAPLFSGPGAGQYAGYAQGNAGANGIPYGSFPRGFEYAQQQQSQDNQRQQQGEAGEQGLNVLGFMGDEGVATSGAGPTESPFSTPGQPSLVGLGSAGSSLLPSGPPGSAPGEF